MLEEPEEILTYTADTEKVEGDKQEDRYVCRYIQGDIYTGYIHTYTET